MNIWTYKLSRKNFFHNQIRVAYRIRVTVPTALVNPIVGTYYSMSLLHPNLCLLVFHLLSPLSCSKSFRAIRAPKYPMHDITLECHTLSTCNKQSGVWNFHLFPYIWPFTIHPPPGVVLFLYCFFIFFINISLPATLPSASTMINFPPSNFPPSKRSNLQTL